MKIVKQVLDYSDTDTNEETTGLLHDTKVFKELVGSWSGSGRLVCADSYFASLQAVEVMVQEGLKSIRVAKLATKKQPMKNVKSIEMQKR